MCTLIAIYRRVPGAHLVVAANRDEYLDRPAEGLAVRNLASGPIVAPRDCRAGGTWLGVNLNGMFAGITNRPCASPNPRHRSRGALVHDALEAGSAARAAERFGDLPENAFNPFNCFFADPESAFVVSYETSPKIQQLAPGVHVIGNADPNDRSVAKVARVMEQAERALAEDPRSISDALARICRDHSGESSPLRDTCVHLGDTYGTRSSALIELGERQEESRLRFADGPPCSSQYEDFTYLLYEQSRLARYDAAGPALRNAN